jgi:hypothetical protein
VANTPTSDVQFAKLALTYPSAKKNMADLLFAYWSDPTRGNNNGVPKSGDDLYAHYGGSELTVSDKAQRFWNNLA